jgi:2-polyprenyl-3-methyl-5-hydroxy-6-metoxy-1,4-benzoquinol methylase
MVQHIYQREVKPEVDDSLARISALIPPDVEVLDIGTGSGALGRHLRTKNCQTDGVTWSAEEAELARPAYRRLEVQDLERELPSARLGETRYDYIVCADILEHLRNDVQMLTDLRGLLVPGGRLLASIPNPTHLGIILSLLAGRFVRMREGLLDATHVQFRDRRGWEALVNQAGFALGARHDVRRSLNETEFAALDFTALPQEIRHYVLSLPDVDVYQFVWELIPCPPEPIAPAPNVLKFPVPPRFAVQLFWDVGAGFNENASQKVWGIQDESVQTLRLALDLREAVALRLDFSDRPGVMEFFHFRLFDAEGELLWSWEGDWNEQLILNECEWPGGRGYQGGRLVRLTGEDGWVRFPFTARMAQATSAEVRLTAPLLYADAAFAWAHRKYQEPMEKAWFQHLDTQTKLDGIRLELDNTRRELDNVYASASWRWSTWLRKLKALLRAVGQ